MNDGETRCAVFCTAKIPTTTLNNLLKDIKDYLSGFPSQNYNPCVSDRIVIIDTKDITTITEGSSDPVASSPTTFLGHTLQEVRDWFDANITQPGPNGFSRHCFLVLDDKSEEDESCIFVCTQGSALGEIASLRCEFYMALQNEVECDIYGRTIKDGLMGSFMRSGVTMTQENYKLAVNGGMYYEDGEVKVDESWKEFSKW